MIPASVNKTILFAREPWPCSPVAEAALHPLTWCSESVSSQGCSSHKQSLVSIFLGSSCMLGYSAR